MKTTASELVGAIKEAEGKKTAGYDTTAEVRRITDGTAWVHIPGGVDETPVALTISAEVGDTVQIRVAGGSAWITGNRSKPPTDDAVAKIARTTATEAQVTAQQAKETADAVDGKASSALTQAAQALSIAGDSNQYFWNTKTGSDTGAHITEVPQDEFTDSTSPNYQSGGNLLARSNGIAVRDGLTELAVFGADGISLRARQSFGTDSPAITSLMRIVPAGILASINGQSYFDINNPGSGTQTIVYTGDGTTKRFRVYPVRNSVFYKRTVTIDDVDVPSTDYSISATQNIYDDYQIEKYYIVFNTAPVEGAEIRISYVPDDSACNFTLGERESETVSGEYSVSIGRWNRAAEKGSLAFGLRNNALGTLSSAIGDDNEVKGTNSHVIGHGLRASRAGVFVVGKYNVDETSYIDIDPSLDNTSQNLFVVGKGSSDSNRSNAFIVDRYGNVEATGSITAEGHTQEIGFFGRRAGSYSCPSNTSYHDTGYQTPATSDDNCLNAGTWLLVAHVTFPSNSTGRRTVRIYNATTAAEIGRSVVTRTATQGATTQMIATCIIQITAKNQYRVDIMQNSGSTASCDVDFTWTRIA